MNRLRLMIKHSIDSYKLNPRYYNWRVVYLGWRVSESMWILVLFIFGIFAIHVVSTNLYLGMIERKVFRELFEFLFSLLTIVTLILRGLYLRFGRVYYDPRWSDYDRNYLEMITGTVGTAGKGHEVVEDFFDNPITYEELSELGFTAVANELKKEGWFDE